MLLTTATLAQGMLTTEQGLLLVVVIAVVLSAVLSMIERRRPY